MSISAPAGDVEEILRREGLSLAETLDPRNYLIAHGLHDAICLFIKKNYTIFS